MKRLFSMSIIFSLFLTACTSSQPHSEGSLGGLRQAQQAPAISSSDLSLLSPTTGLPLKTSNNSQFFSVMMDNSKDARPQSGLSEADFVYESKTEDGSTGYLAFFHDSIPDLIGSVTTAPPYFIPIAEEWNATFIYYGGSNITYPYLKKSKVHQVDGKSKPNLFFKDPTSAKNHNYFFQPPLFQSISVQPINDHFSFGNGNLSNYEDISKVSISFNIDTNVTYQYHDDGKNASYSRLIDGTQDSDKNGGFNISANNVILQYVNYSPDSSGKVQATLIGKGRAIFLTKGKEIDGTWFKESTSSPTKFFDDEGKLILLSPGKTWIEIIDDETKVSLE